MAKSSIHIEAGGGGYFAHNSRETPTVNSIFSDEKNFVSCSKNEAFEVYRSELQIRSEAYTERTGQKLQKNTITHLSAVVNFNKEHTPEDMQRVCDLLERKLDTKVIQYAMHRDEGHIREDGTPDKNYHAHIEFMGLDSNGESVRRKLDRPMLKELQSEVAKTLGMERGKDYAKERTPRPKRLDTYEYKAHVKAIEEVKIATQAETARLREELEREKLSKEQIKEEFERLRKENANQGFTSSFFRELTEEKKRQLKEPSMNRKEIREFVESLKESHRGFLGVNKDAVIEELKEKLNRQAIENASLKAIALEAISSVDSEKKRLAEEAERFAEKQDKEYREIVSNEKKRWEKKREELTLQSVLNEVVLMRDEAIKILEKSLKSIEEKYNQVKESFSKLLSEKLKLEAENETLNKKVKTLTEMLETAQKSLETKKTTQSIAQSQKRKEIDARAKVALVKKKQEQDRGFER